MRGFFVRKEAKAHGTKKLVEGLHPSETLAGKSVAVIEDVTTEGGSAMKAVEPAGRPAPRCFWSSRSSTARTGREISSQTNGIPFKALFVASEFLNR